MSEGFILASGAIAVNEYSTFSVLERHLDVLTPGWMVMEKTISGSQRLLLKGLSQEQAQGVVDALQESPRLR
jgi:hypothetical protein